MFKVKGYTSQNLVMYADVGPPRICPFSSVAADDYSDGTCQMPLADTNPVSWAGEEHRIGRQRHRFKGRGLRPEYVARVGTGSSACVHGPYLVKRGAGLPTEFCVAFLRRELS